LTASTIMLGEEKKGVEGRKRRGKTHLWVPPSSARLISREKGKGEGKGRPTLTLIHRKGGRKKGDKLFLLDTDSPTSFSRTSSSACGKEGGEGKKKFFSLNQKGGRRKGGEGVHYFPYEVVVLPDRQGKKGRISSPSLGKEKKKRKIS